MSALLLVHGAWQGAWVWREVIRRAADAGVSATAIDLPGSGADTTPLSDVTLAGYAEAIIAAAESLCAEDVTLVAHSMGGAAATAAASAAPRAFRRVVYVAAFVPGSGESVGMLSAQSHALGTDGPRAEPLAEGAGLALTETSIRETFLHDCSPAVIADAIARFRPQAVAPLRTPLETSAGFETLPKSYLVCTQDRAVSPIQQAMMAARAGIRDIGSLASGHEPFLSQPAALTERLLICAAP